MENEKVSSHKDLLTTIRENYNHFDEEYCLNEQNLSLNELRLS